MNNARITTDANRGSQKTDLTYQQGKRHKHKQTLFLLALSGSLAFAGCSKSTANFSTNEVRILKVNETKVFSARAMADLRNVLAALFGTPDDPLVPETKGMSEVIDVRKLRLAAGPVFGSETRQTRGLFRRHCAHCHGLAGDGNGPTAQFLNPYPRDFRYGIFKFKSTVKGVKPTHDDLTKILFDGIPGTAMPSFKLLHKDEIEALVHYVKYLSIRGQVERFLIQQTSELEDDDRLFDKGLDREKRNEKKEPILEELAKWQKAWSSATSTPVPKRVAKTELPKSARLGRELFYGGIAKCTDCHGDSGLGDGDSVTSKAKPFYDEWTLDWTAGITDPTDTKQVAVFLNHGALKPRKIRPRNLRQGVFRGGHRPIDIYWRIKNGIDGTPMQAVAMRTPTSPGLTDEQIWQLVDYVRNWLPYESLSKPPQNKVYQRDRL